MTTPPNGIERQAAFYRGYLIDDRNLAPLTGVLVTAVALWLLFYLISSVGPQPDPRLKRPPQQTAFETAWPTGPTSPIGGSTPGPAPRP